MAGVDGCFRHFSYCSGLSQPPFEQRLQGTAIFGLLFEGIWSVWWGRLSGRDVRQPTTGVPVRKQRENPGLPLSSLLFSLGWQPIGWHGPN